MPMSEHLQRIREKVGHDLLVLPSAAVAIHDKEDRLLLGLHAEKKLWVLPGGLIEAGELPADGAVREVWEEMGLLVHLTGILGVYGGEPLIVHYANGDRASYVNVLFSGRIVTGELSVDGEEILEARYFSQAEMAAIPHPRWMDLAMAVLFSDGGRVDFQQSTWKPASKP
jgi:8-oxo-dGTP pyrophosphatase MutT (NUDIX family)